MRLETVAFTGCPLGVEESRPPSLYTALQCGILPPYMHLVAQLKLTPTPEQADLLRRTLETANAAANAVSTHAHATKTFRTYDLHRACYYDIRHRFGLTAQMAVRVLAKVGDSYKTGDHHSKRTFRPHGSIAYDSRILSFNHTAQTVSIWSVEGRQMMAFVCGERQRRLLEHQRGETDLVLRNGQFYLLTTCDVDDPDAIDVDAALGIDLGVTNIAVDSDGETYSGSTIKNMRHRHRRLRRKLQRKGTHGARRRLRQLAGQERRFATHTNHVISKRIVAKAEGTKRAIAVEDLTHIRTRVTARRSQRATLHSWSFAQLQQFVAYKARLSGIPVHRVDPRNTSRTCPACGHIDRVNRKTQASFVCTSCSFAGLADVIAAVNIGRRAACKPAELPGCSTARGVAPGQSCLL